MLGDLIPQPLMLGQPPIDVVGYEGHYPTELSYNDEGRPW